ncbi:MAG: ATP-binding cassette domain-containing protein [Rhizobiales bacterium]|nr:ATP-binding cassette domain-containing protein [Hyphomicrobiales bacterium]
MMMLTVENLSVSYRGIPAVRHINFSLAPGTATALIGANGAGKSSTLLAIARALDTSARMSGRIDVAAGHKVSMVPERNKIFALLTVAENLTAADRQRGRGRVRVDDVYHWFPRLAERRTSLAGNLSGGEQQMLAFGMALTGSPSLLLLDEPTLGLAVPIIERTCDTLAQLRRELDLTLLCAEADPQWIDRFAENALIMVRGAIAATFDTDLTSHRDEIRSLVLGLQDVST